MAPTRLLALIALVAVTCVTAADPEPRPGRGIPAWAAARQRLKGAEPGYTNIIHSKCIELSLGIPFYRCNTREVTNVHVNGVRSTGPLKVYPRASEPNVLGKHCRQIYDGIPCQESPRDGDPPLLVFGWLDPKTGLWGIPSKDSKESSICCYGGKKYDFKVEIDCLQHRPLLSGYSG